MDARMPLESASSNMTELTADIVSAYISKNAVRAEELAGLISTVHAALSEVGNANSAASVGEAKPTAPMSWKKAIKHDYIISFEDGKQYKSMKRHLTRHGLTPQQYREKWSLPKDFPMVAPSYSAARSEMAKNLGLGQKRPAARKSRKGASKKTA